MPDEAPRNQVTLYLRANGDGPPVGVGCVDVTNAASVAYPPTVGEAPAIVYERLVLYLQCDPPTFLTAVSLPPRGYLPPPGPDDVCLTADGEEVVRVDKGGGFYVQGHKLENPGDVVSALRGVALAIRHRERAKRQRAEQTSRYEREVEP